MNQLECRRTREWMLADDSIPAGSRTWEHWRFLVDTPFSNVSTVLRILKLDTIMLSRCYRWTSVRVPVNKIGSSMNGMTSLRDQNNRVN